MSSFTYGGLDQAPGQRAQVNTFENEFKWGPWEAMYRSGKNIKASSVDAGNTGYTSILRQGLLMGIDLDTDELVPWDPTATDGSEYIWGILDRTVNMHNALGADTARLTGPIMVGGGVLSNKLIIPGETDLGLSADADLEYLARQQLRQNFMLNDSYYFGRPEYVIHTVSASEQSSGITLTLADTHRHYYNTGGTVAITLPTTPYKGVEFKFTSVDTGNDNSDDITVGSGSSNIQVPGTTAANSLTVSAANNRLVGTGSLWLVESL